MNVRLALFVLLVFSCSGYREKRAATAKEMAGRLYPGWTIVGVAANDGCTEPKNFVSVTVRDPQTGAVHRLALKCVAEGDDDRRRFCVEATAAGC